MVHVTSSLSHVLPGREASQQVHLSNNLSQQSSSCGRDLFGALSLWTGASALAEAGEKIQVFQDSGASFLVLRICAITLIEGDVIYLAAPNETHRQKCEERLHEVTSALTERTGRNLTIEVILETTSSRKSVAEDKPEMAVEEETEIPDVHSLEDAPANSGDELSVISKSFPGAQIIDEDS